MPSLKTYPIKTTAAGRTYDGAYELASGQVRVLSQYGSKSAPVGRNAKITATLLLEEIIGRRR